MFKLVLVAMLLLVGCEKSSSTTTAPKDAAITPSPSPPTPTPKPTPPTVPIDALVAPDPAPTAPSCAHTCGNAEDCPTIPCKCEDGTVVNTRSCSNNCCLDEAESCSSSCKSHDGPQGTWNDARDGKRTGKGCSADRDCASNVCLHGTCSKTCTSFGDCPPFWDCVEGKQIGQRFCEKK